VLLLEHGLLHVVRAVLRLQRDAHRLACATADRERNQHDQSGHQAHSPKRPQARRLTCAQPRDSTP